MKKTVVILVVLFSTIIFSSPLFGDNNKKADSHELVKELVSVVTSILQGKDYNNFRNNISPEVYVIINNNYESVFEVLGNSSKYEN